MEVVMAEATPAAIEWHGGRRAAAAVDLMDALPYVDHDYADPQLKAEVEQMIEEEMAKSSKRPSDFLVHLPPLPHSNFDTCPMLSKAMERVRAGLPPETLDMHRYGIQSPLPSKLSDADAWKTALDNAKSQLQHQAIRFDNVELMLQYGANAWRVHNQHLEAVSTKLEGIAREYSREIDILNRQRKLNQQAAASVLSHFKLQWKAACQKNIDIRSACINLESEIESLRNLQNHNHSAQTVDLTVAVNGEDLTVDINAEKTSTADLTVENNSNSANVILSPQS